MAVSIEDNALMTKRFTEEQIVREAERAQRPRSELVREAIAEYLARQERERFRREIARAAAAPGEDAVAVAEEALPLDNEALALVARAIREPAPRYRRPRRRS